MKNCSPSDYVTTEQVFSNGCGCPVGVIYTCTCMFFPTHAPCGISLASAHLIDCFSWIEHLPSHNGDDNGHNHFII